MMVAAKERSEVEMARRLCPKQKSDSLLHEPVSRLSRWRDLVLDPFPGILSTAVPCL